MSAFDDDDDDDDDEVNHRFKFKETEFILRWPDSHLNCSHLGHSFLGQMTTCQGLACCHDVRSGSPKTRGVPDTNSIEIRGV